MLWVYSVRTGRRYQGIGILIVGRLVDCQCGSYVNECILCVCIVCENCVCIVVYCIVMLRVKKLYVPSLTRRHIWTYGVSSTHYIHTYIQIHIRTRIRHGRAWSVPNAQLITLQKMPKMPIWRHPTKKLPVIIERFYLLQLKTYFVSKNVLL